MKVMGLPPLERATWREWSTSLMSSAQAAPGLPLDFAMPTTHAKRLSRALAMPSLREGREMGDGAGRRPSPPNQQRGARSRPWGMRRSEVKEEVGRSPAGGHERSRAPHGLLRFQRVTSKQTATFNQHHCPPKRTNS